MPILTKVLKPVIVFLFLAMTLITFLATLARMFPALPSLYWAGEATRYLNFWVTCLGIGVALQTGSHFTLTMLTERLSTRSQRILAVISHLVVTILFAVMIYYGVQMITWNFDQFSAAMEVPMAYVYMGIPICGVLVVLQTLYSLLRIVTGRDSGQPATGDTP
ncbi:TRAP transporter small permease [Aurantimonas sp. VKM B-3413]|uniref:TRAP transporter small permease n=1 Tax=Aurantimonas sp. VKM B-3413 TaxID=2779401 RepID=UPI001E307318|nr:TRAP transporter small permease [Aurantimonas sp. VKM B-3413]MCB8838056.1 TRAP transporter small permease [Aurantimonas sp. VKM B-3413]